MFCVDIHPPSGRDCYGIPGRSYSDRRLETFPMRRAARRGRSSERLGSALEGAIRGDCRALRGHASDRGRARTGGGRDPCRRDVASVLTADPEVAHTVDGLPRKSALAGCGTRVIVVAVTGWASIVFGSFTLVAMSTPVAPLGGLRHADRRSGTLNDATYVTSVARRRRCAAARRRLTSRGTRRRLAVTARRSYGSIRR